MIKLKDLMKEAQETVLKIYTSGKLKGKYSLRYNDKLYAGDAKDVGEIEDKLKKNKVHYTVVKTGSSNESLNEANFKIYHDTLTSAVTDARHYATSRGYTIDEDDWFREIATGPKKPSEGKTNSYSIGLATPNGNPAKKALHIQVYGMSKKYELNCYIS